MSAADRNLPLGASFNSALERSVAFSRKVAEKRYTLVRREWESQGSVSQCCRGDEGWPLEVGVQKLASNQAVLLWFKRSWL